METQIRGKLSICCRKGLMEFAGYVELRGDAGNKIDLDLDCRNGTDPNWDLIACEVGRKARA